MDAKSCKKSNTSTKINWIEFDTSKNSITRIAAAPTTALPMAMGNRLFGQKRSINQGTTNVPIPMPTSRIRDEITLASEESLCCVKYKGIHVERPYRARPEQNAITSQIRKLLFDKTHQ